MNEFDVIVSACAENHLDHSRMIESTHTKSASYGRVDVLAGEYKFASDLSLGTQERLAVSMLDGRTMSRILILFVERGGFTHFFLQ